MLSYAGLPDIWHLPERYNPLQISRMVWLAERWWWRTCHGQIESLIADALAHRGLSEPELEEAGRVAMNVIARLGAWSAKRFGEVAKSRRRIPGTAKLKPVQMAAPIPGEISWERLAGETWEEFKHRVFGPLVDATFGIATDFLDRYVAKRLPPIANADEQLRRRVRDVVHEAQGQVWTDRELESALRSAGNWPLARVRTQIRTETSTMYNGGRFAHMAEDEAIVGYEYDVTQDDRTSDICEELVGVTVAKDDLTAVPPNHPNCRTVLVPIFEWQSGFQWSDPSGIPSPGEGNYAQYEGFGQHDLIDEFR